MYCSNCGYELENDAMFCSSCGKNINNNSEITVNVYGEFQSIRAISNNKGENNITFVDLLKIKNKKDLFCCLITFMLVLLMLLLFYVGNISFFQSFEIDTYNLTEKDALAALCNKSYFSEKEDLKTLVDSGTIKDISVASILLYMFQDGPTCEKLKDGSIKITFSGKYRVNSYGYLLDGTIYYIVSKDGTVSNAYDLGPYRLDDSMLSVALNVLQ